MLLKKNGYGREGMDEFGSDEPKFFSDFWMFLTWQDSLDFMPVNINCVHPSPTPQGMTNMWFYRTTHVVHVVYSTHIYFVTNKTTTFYFSVLDQKKSKISRGGGGREKHLWKKNIEPFFKK